jgi:hypothetical protein
VGEASAVPCQRVTLSSVPRARAYCRASSVRSRSGCGVPSGEASTRGRGTPTSMRRGRGPCGPWSRQRGGPRYTNMPGQRFAGCSVSKRAAVKSSRELPVDGTYAAFAHIVHTAPDLPGVGRVAGSGSVSIVHLPTCPNCKWTMRQVRVCERDNTAKVRVFECARCHTEAIWTPAADQRRRGAREQDALRLASVGQRLAARSDQHVRQATARRAPSRSRQPACRAPAWKWIANHPRTSQTIPRDAAPGSVTMIWIIAKTGDQSPEPLSLAGFLRGTARRQSGGGREQTSTKTK